MCAGGILLYAGRCCSSRDSRKPSENVLRHGRPLRPPLRHDPGFFVGAGFIPARAALRVRWKCRGRCPHRPDREAANDGRLRDPPLRVRWNVAVHLVGARIARPRRASGQRPPGGCGHPPLRVRCVGVDALIDLSRRAQKTGARISLLRLVRERRLELPRHRTHAPQTCLSTIPALSHF